ncbi:MAG: substrate-binding periplasmic protein [Phototrophicaceae bacterium]
MPKHLQHLLTICLFLWVGATITTPARAQSDATCEAIVQNAWQTAHTNCQLIRLNQVCYGNANVLTTARSASSLSLTQPGQVGSALEFQSILANGYNQATRHYGVSLLTIPTNTNDRTTLQLYGNALLENLTTPLVELPFTVGTIGNIHITPSMSSQVIASMISGDTLIGLGRVEVSGTQWIKMVSQLGSGWVPAFVVKETALVSSLSPLSFEAVQTQSLTRMKLTLASKDDRPCANAPDSGLFIQTPNSTLLELNGVRLVIDRTVTAWVQSAPNNTLDVYALQGVLSVESAGVAVSVSGGQFTTVPVGLDGFATGVPTQARTYLNEKVRVLPLATSPLPEGVVISPGTNDLGVAMSALPMAEPTAGLPVTNSEVVLTTPEGVDPGMLAGLVVNPEATPQATVESVVVAPVVEVVAVPSTANSALSAFAQSIQARGSIRIGVNGSFPAFSMRIDDATYQGFEIEIAKELVRRLFGESMPIEWVKVSGRQQPEVLSTGAVDLLIRNTVFASDRTSWGEWTNTFYFVDGQRFMVRADSGLTSNDQLAGRAVAVQTGTLAEQTLQDAGLGVNVMPIQATLIEVFAALQDGQVEAVSDNWATLEALRATAPNATDYQIIGDLLTSETYSMVVPLGQTAFRDEIDATLGAIIGDGTWRTLYDASFDSILPATAELVFAPLATNAGAVETVAVEPVAVQEVAPVVEVVATEAVASPPTTTANATLPLSGRIPVRIFTVPEQIRDIELTAEADGTMMVKLIRLGEVVYSSRYKLAEDGRWLNVRNSFENVQFSATAGDESLGCTREADVRGFLNGASFEGKLNCQP